MRILLLNYEYPPLGGGAANASQALAREWAALGHEVVVLTSRFRGLPAQEREGEVLILRAPGWRRRKEKCSVPEMAAHIIGARAALGRVVARASPDVAVAFFGIPGGPVARKAWRKFGIPYIVSLRGGDVPGAQPGQLAVWHALLRPYIRGLWDEAAAVVANSDGLAHLAKQTAPEREIHVIPNGVDAGRFTPRNDERERRPGEPVSCLYVGRLSPEKNLDAVIGALAGARDAPSWRFLIAGDGPERDRLEREAARRGVAGRVEFLGWRDRETLPDLYREADLFLFNSESEGMPNAVLEAMAAGLPVVSSSVRGAEDVVEHEKTGLLVPVGNENALRVAIERALRDEAWRRRAGAAGIEQARRFSWRAAAEAYVGLFERAVAGDRQ